jgi:hypothetical protein
MVVLRKLRLFATASLFSTALAVTGSVNIDSASTVGSGINLDQ